MFELFIEEPLFLMTIIIIVAIFVKSYRDYKKSTYYEITKNSYFDAHIDKGKHGEYLTYGKLKRMEQEGARFLFNLYIPKKNGATTEIDVLMISKKGIFVFESKNYSGWIFGCEDQKYWYQTLPAGRRYRGYYITRGGKKSNKEKFYNPVKQNRAHIKALKLIIEGDIPVWSIIVFSERCTLKDIKIISDEVVVINRYDLKRKIDLIYNRNSAIFLGDDEIANIYERLYPYTKVSEDIKKLHVRRIRNKVEYAPRSVGFRKERNEKDSQKCPRCSGALVLRTAKQGRNSGSKFYGCVNYPNCTYIKNFERTYNNSNNENGKDEFFG